MNLPSYINPEAWQGYVDMRKEMKKPLTERAMQLALRKLDRLLQEGEDPNEVLDQSTYCNWQKLYPVKEDFNGSKTTSIGGTGNRSFADQERDRHEQAKREAARILGIRRRGFDATGIPDAPEDNRRGTESVLDRQVIEGAKVEAD